MYSERWSLEILTICAQPQSSTHSAKKSIWQNTTSVRVYYKESGSLKGSVALYELAVRRGTKLWGLRPCFCFQWLFLVCSNGSVKLGKTVGFCLWNNPAGTEVRRPWFVLKINHYADPLRKRAAECIFPPAPASHSQVDIVINSRTVSSSQGCVVVRK